MTVPQTSETGRRYPTQPVAGVGALALHEGKLLRVQRSREPLRGWWSLPGGAIELRREFREEKGFGPKNSDSAAN